MTAPPTPQPVLNHADDSAAEAAPTRRWFIAGMLFLAAVLNYIDRNLLGLLAPAIKAELGLTDADYARVANLFLIAYLFSYLFSGRIVDAVGARVGMVLFIGFWSVANALTGLARGASSLGAFRFMLGLGEAGGWTASPKVVADWFRPKERALAVGLYSIGSTVGATVAPFLVFLTATGFGWRGAFVLTGLLGVAWIVPWLLIARRAPAGASGHAPGAGASAVEVRETALWLSILAQPAVWCLMLARLMTDSTWYFYQFWMPTYLHDVRGVAQERLWVMMFVYLAADVGFLAGGFLSDRLVRRGASPAAGRVRLMLAAACLVPVSALMPAAASVPWVLAIGGTVALAHCVWLGNLSTLVVDVVPARTLATTFGFIGAGSAAGGILMNQLVVWAIGSYSYDRVFFVMACLHPLALLLVWPLRKQTAGAG